MLAALSYAHVKLDNDGTPLQLIHRDVSPSNVLLSLNGEVKLTDFGIATAQFHGRLTAGGRAMGTPHYMSPEQSLGAPNLDERSDIFSLCMLFHELLGVEHILSGYDHLLFVIGLLFLVGFRRQLVWTISAFTLAHSLTLASAAFSGSGLSGGLVLQTQVRGLKSTEV